MEEWRPVANFPWYLVSSEGRVKGPRRVLKPAVTDDNYHKVKLYREDGLPCHRFVHHLVLEAFIGPRPDGLQCRHLNGDSATNRLANLTWGSPEENSADRTRHGTDNRGERCGRAILTWAIVGMIRSEYVFGSRTHGSRALAEKFGCDRARIHRIVNNQIWIPEEPPGGRQGPHEPQGDCNGYR